MRSPHIASLIAFAFLSVIAWFRPLITQRRRRATVIGAAGTSLILLIQLLRRAFPHAASVVGDWLPGLLMLMVYWQAGSLFTCPNTKLQRMLEQFDRDHFSAVLQRRASRWSKTWLGSYFELTYLVCYPLLPLGTAVLYATGLRRAVDDYWTAILISTYLCYLVLPFAQTLPPRLFTEESCLPSTRIRRLNLWVLQHASIKVNTFPSAHVASTLAASFVLLRLVPVAGLIFLLISSCIAFAAVVGRYHYLPDVLTGALIPLVIFVLY